MAPPLNAPSPLEARALRARRTAAWLGGFAAAVFVGFLAISVVTR